MKRALLAFAGVAGAAVAGTAIAASSTIHRMDVPLPDGGMVLVEYAGDVAPKVTIAPAEPRWAPTAFPFPAMGSFDRMFEQLDRQMRAAEEAARRAPGMPGLNVASFGALPGGTSSISVITTSNGGASCARTTEVVSQGAGKPPKVTTNVTGDCGPGAATPQGAPSASSRPIDRT